MKYEDFLGSLNQVEIFDSYRNNKIYNGASDKFGITYGYADYIIKRSKGPDDLSVITEHVASSLIRDFGVPCHKTNMATYNGELVVMIKDFTNDGTELRTFEDTGESSIDTDINSKEYTYDDIIDIINKHIKLDSEDKDKFIKSFWEMFIVDAILANRDRHSGNWGYIINTFGKYEFAPLYDNGGSLFPGVLGKLKEYADKSTRKQFLKDRVYTFPASQFKVYSDDSRTVKKTNYYEVFTELLKTNNIFKEVCESFIERVDGIFHKVLDKNINCIVTGKYPTVDILLRNFYIDIITLRYRCIVKQEDFDTVYNLILRS